MVLGNRTFSRHSYVGLRKTLYDHWGLAGTKTGFLAQVGKDPYRYPPTALRAAGMSESPANKFLKPGLSTALLCLGYLVSVSYFVDLSFLLSFFFWSAFGPIVLRCTAVQRQTGRRFQGEAWAFWECLTLLCLSFLQNAHSSPA